MCEQTNELISIVLITYNSEETVRETLDSFIDQDYPRLELVVADDSSQDNTIKIIKEWLEENGNKKRFENIIINVNEQNSGVTANCNKGIKLASGSYIQLIAGDDILLPDCCSKKSRFSKDFGQKIVYSQVEVFSDKKDLLLAQEMTKVAERGYEIMRMGNDVQFTEIIKENYIPGPCGSFFEKAFMTKAMGGYDERFRNIEDWPFHLKYLSQKNRIRLLEEPLVKYRVRGDSLCHSGGNNFENDVFNFFIEVRLKYLLEYRQYDVIVMQWRDLDARRGRESNNAYIKIRLYYDELYQWMSIKQSGMLLASYFIDNACKSIAIYGLGATGRLLKKELSGTDVLVKYAIDRISEGVRSDIDVLGIDDDLPEVDAIVVTPTYAFNEVKEMLEKKVNCPIISLHKIIEDFYYQCNTVQ